MTFYKHLFTERKYKKGMLRVYAVILFLTFMTSIFVTLPKWESYRSDMNDAFYSTRYEELMNKSWKQGKEDCYSTCLKRKSEMLNSNECVDDYYESWWTPPPSNACRKCDNCFEKFVLTSPKKYYNFPQYQIFYANNALLPFLGKLTITFLKYCSFVIGFALVLHLLILPTFHWLIEGFKEEKDGKK